MLHRERIPWRGYFEYPMGSTTNDNLNRSMYGEGRSQEMIGRHCRRAPIFFRQFHLSGQQNALETRLPVIRSNVRCDLLVQEFV
jgi:hypothetical protein